jgi:hypothetical protein
MGVYPQTVNSTIPACGTIQLTYLCLQLPPSRSGTPTAFTNKFLPVHAEFSTAYTLHEAIHLVVSTSDSVT